MNSPESDRTKKMVIFLRQTKSMQEQALLLWHKAYLLMYLVAKMLFSSMEMHGHSPIRRIGRLKILF